MTIDYKPLMTSKEIPWHNPRGLTPEQVDPNGEGWRLATLDEVCADSPLRGKCERFWDSWWDADRWYCNSLNQTYRTRKPLPEKYRNLVEPDYSDPAYRASVEEAFRNGAAIEDRHPHYQPEWEAASRMCAFNWNGGWEHRIAPNQPAKDPAPDSDAHKLAEVIAAADAGKACEYWNEGHGKWIPERTVADVARSIIYGRKVRIKPTTPVKVPLSDYRVSEVIKALGRIAIICGVEPDGSVRCENGDWFTPQYLVNSAAKIHRNGTWQDCFTLAD